MRDLMLLVIIFAMISIALYRPLAGYLFWTWASLIAPPAFAFGYMHSARVSLILGIVTLISAVARIGTLPLRRLFNPASALLVLFLFHSMVCAFMAPEANVLNDELSAQFAKTCLFALAMPLFIVQKSDMQVMILTIGLGLGFHGVNEGLKVLVTGGAHRDIGVPLTMLGDNNQFAVAIAMVVPLLIYLSRYLSRKVMRMGFLMAAAISVCAILGSRSRGGLIALIVMLTLVALLSQRRLRMVLAITIAGVSALQFMPDTWLDRYETIVSAGVDLSFMGRVIAWKASSAAALDSPAFGIGFHGIQFQPNWEKYRYSQGLLGFIDTPESESWGKAAHSIYFEVLGDLGFVGLLLYLLLFFRAAYSWRWIALRTRHMLPTLAWAKDLANTLITAIVAFAAGGASLSLAYYEAPYMLLMLLELLRFEVRTQFAAEARVRS